MPEKLGIDILSIPLDSVIETTEYTKDMTIKLPDSTPASRKAERLARLTKLAEGLLNPDERANYITTQNRIEEDVERILLATRQQPREGGLSGFTMSHRKEGGFTAFGTAGFDPMYDRESRGNRFEAPQPRVESEPGTGPKSRYGVRDATSDTRPIFDFVTTPDEQVEEITRMLGLPVGSVKRAQQLREKP